MSLPSTGEANWGVPLNDYIDNVVLAEASLAEQTITTHQVANDPHGDRAYALSLFTPITSGVNGPNGFLQLSNIGKIPNSVLPTGGGRTSTFDVVKDYAAPVAATLAGVVDCSSQLQAALADCSASGGGEVWVGSGFYGVGETLVVGANTWLHLAPGAMMTRVVGTAGVAPAYMVANYGSSSTSGASNILVEGGAWNFASQAAAGAPMVFAGSSFAEIRECVITALAGGAAILLAGQRAVTVRDVEFSAPSPASNRAICANGLPAVRIEAMTAAAVTGLPASMTSNGSINNAPCAAVSVNSCAITAPTASDGTGLYTAVNGLAGSAASVSGVYHTGVSITDNYAVALPGNAVNGINWSQVAVNGNIFNLNAGTAFAQEWVPGTPPVTWIIVANNQPPDAWHDMRPCATGFVGSNSGQYPPQYRMSGDGTVMIFGSVGIPLTGYTSTPIFASPLPAAYRPAHTIQVDIALSQNGTTALLTAPVAQIGSDGVIELMRFPAGLPEGTLAYFEVSYPSVGSNGLIAS